MMKSVPQFILTFLIFLFSCVAIAYEDYDWKNVPIGGGGYITGMKIHPLNGEKRFYRTDVGGAYRWDVQTQSLKQMVFSTNSSHYSVAGIALHPTNQNIVYLAVGRDCKTANTAILKSTDGGVNFSEVSIVGGVKFHFAANGGRTCDSSDDLNTPNKGDKDRQGTPLAINPLNPNELYIGTREKGLWVLDLTTLVATQMNTTQIPTNVTQYSIRSVVFHPTLNFVYIAYPGHGVYVGNTLSRNFWNLDFPGGADYPQLLQATDISISKNADYMLVACEKAGIMKATGIDTNNQSIGWTELAGGLSSTNGNSGYYTVDTSPHDNNVAVTVTAGWNHLNEFQATTDGGESWNMVSGSVNLDDHLFKWRSDAFASHVAQLAFDPDDPNRLHYTSWFSTFSSDNWSPTSGGIWHSLRAQGHEEIVPTDLVAFPKNVAGNILMTGSGDHSGFVFDDSIVDPLSFPTNHLDQLTNTTDKSSLSADKIKKSASFSFSEKQPDNLAVILTDGWDGSAGALLTSSDGGDSWVRKNGYLTTYKKSHIEFASNDPDSMVLLNGSQVRFTKDGGDTFTPSVGSNAYPDDCGLPFDGAPISSSLVSNIPKFNNNVFGAGRYLTADKELNCVFYFYSPDGSFNISSDGGETFGIISTDLPATTDLWNKTRLVSIPDNAGHLFINIQNNLWKTTNGGRNWSRVASVDQARALSFGAGFDAYPALYIFGRLNKGSDNHFYRSDDAGQSWIRINEHSEKEVWGDNKIIAGDRNIPGRLYATASGQGVVFGERIWNAPDSGIADSGITDSGIADSGITDSGITDLGIADSVIADGDFDRWDFGNEDLEVADAGDTNQDVDVIPETPDFGNTGNADNKAVGDTADADFGNEDLGTEDAGDTNQDVDIIPETPDSRSTGNVDNNADGDTNVPAAGNSNLSGGGASSVFLLLFLYWTTLISRRRFG